MTRPQRRARLRRQPHPKSPPEADATELRQTEAQFQRAVIDYARLMGFRVAHFRSVRVQRRDGSIYYATPVHADGEGWPDLVLVRPPRIIFAELKSQGGKVEPAQNEWLDAFARVPGCEVFVWKPSDWDAIEKVLAR